MLDDLYQEHIIDHYRHPRNKRTIKNTTLGAKAMNPLCGDVVLLFVRLDGDVVAEAAFQGDGCAISQAATSMLTEHIHGKTVDDLKRLAPGDIYSMLRIPISPGRVNCALLPYKALEDGLTQHALHR